MLYADCSPLNNSLLKHPGANTPGLFTVFNVLYITLSQSKSLPLLQQFLLPDALR